MAQDQHDETVQDTNAATHGEQEVPGVGDTAPDFELALRQSEMDLAILTAYMIRQKWKDSELNIVTCIPNEREGEEDDEEFEQNIREQLERVIEIARLPNPRIVVLSGPFEECLAQAPRSDIDVMGMASPPNFERMRESVKKTRSTCVFVADSGQESAMA